ncbi:MAG: 4Fe-4S binding protein, partial [Bacilli bacterium]|nr:4Fe-4S binding protein [Bacilli bacterium]
GVPTDSLVRSRFPDTSFLVKPKAILECYEDISCNPCATNCPFKAITIADGLNSQPVLNPELCTGCGICIYSCPGLAISVVQIVEDKARFKIPYEFLPIPNSGEVWSGLNRTGERICDASIINVTDSKRQDKTVVVTVDVDKKYLYEFITIKVQK